MSLLNRVETYNKMNANTVKKMLLERTWMLWSGKLESWT